jgi:hypothetical protein
MFLSKFLTFYITMLSVAQFHTFFQIFLAIKMFVDDAVAVVVVAVVVVVVVAVAIDVLIEIKLNVFLLLLLLKLQQR